MKRLVFLMLAAVLLMGFAAAQTPTGKIVGRVTDDQGAVLPGVAIEARSPKLVGATTAVTDENGIYRLLALPSGTYTVTFTLQGFKTVKREGIILQLEQTLTLDLKMEQTAIAEEITVVGKSPLIDVKSTTKGATMTKELFNALPKGRDFATLLNTMAGVQLNDNNTGGLSVDGATGTENVFMVDGTNTSNVRTGVQAQNAVTDMLEELQVSASGYQAQFGGSMGGVVNVITRSGGNAFHGDVALYYNDNSLLMNGKTRDFLRYNPYNDYAIEYINNDDLYFNGGKDRDIVPRYDGTFGLGGYILKDRIWFYGLFNPAYQKQTGKRWFTVDPVDLSQAVLPGDAAHDPRQGRPTYAFTREDTWFNAQAKLTFMPAPGLRVQTSFVNNFNKYRGFMPNITGTSSKTYEWGKQGFDFPNWSASVNADYTVSNNFLVSFRGGMFSQDQTNQQLKWDATRYVFATSNYIYNDIPEGLKHYSGFIVGPNTVANTYETKSFLLQRISANLDLTYFMNFMGEHAWKFGVQFVRLREKVDAGLQHPSVTLQWGVPYNGLATGQPVMGTYGHYQVISGFSSPYGNNWDVHSDNWSIYLQDSWTIGERLTLNLGLRTESEYIPSFATNDPLLKDIKAIQFGFDQKIAPRFGVIYDVFGDSSLKVFGNFAIYYDVMKLYMAEGAFGGFKWVTDYYELNDPDWTKIAASGQIDDRASQEGANRYVGSMNWRIPSFDTTDPDMKPTAKSGLQFGLEKRLTEDISFVARFTYNHLIRTIEDIGIMTPEGEEYYNANPGEGWSRPISQGGKFPDNLWPSPKPDWNFYGVNLEINKRFSNNWQGGFNYTWSRTVGNYGGLSSTDEGGRNSPNVERYYDLWFLQYDLSGTPLSGVLPTDRTHVVKVFGSYSFPFGLTVGWIGTGRSGQPLSTQLSLNNVNVYPENRYNEGKRLPFQYWLDLLLQYNFRIAKKYGLQIELNVNQLAPKLATAQATLLNRDTIRATDDQILTGSFDYMSKISGNTTGPAAAGMVRPHLTYGMATAFMNNFNARLGVRFSF